MIKNLLLIIMFLCSSAIFADEPVQLYLKVNNNFRLDEECVDYIFSNTSVVIEKKDNHLILRNLGLGLSTSVILTLIKSDGSIKTYKINDVAVPTPYQGRENSTQKYGDYVRIQTKVMVDKTDSEKKYFNRIENSISFKKNKINYYADLNTYNNNETQQSKIMYPFVKKAGVSDGLNKYEYKSSGNIGSDFTTVSVKNISELKISQGSLLADAKYGVLSDKYPIRSLILQYDKFNLFSNYSDNQKQDIYHYIIGSGLTFSKMSFNLKTDLNIENINKNDYINYNRAYVFSTNYAIKKTISRLSIDSIGISRDNYMDNLISLNGALINKHLIDTINLKSHVDQFSIGNTYTKYTTDFSDTNVFSNTILYDDNIDTALYKVESNYITSRTGVNHSINGLYSKRFYNFENTFGVTLDKLNSYSDNLNYSYNSFSISTGYQFFQNKQSDQFNLVLRYQKDSFSNIISYNKNNIFYGQSNLQSVEDRTTINNFFGNSQFSAYVRNTKYSDIGKTNTMLGIALTFNLEKEINFNDFGKTTTKKILFCKDIDFDGKCDVNDLPYSNRSVIVQSGTNFTKYVTDINGYISLEFKQNEHKTLNIDFDKNEALVSSDVSENTQSIGVQDQRHVKLNIINQKNNEIISEDVIGIINCGSKYSKQIIVSGMIDLNIPKTSCLLTINSADNTIVPIEADVSFELNDQEVSIQLNPLQRLSFSFYIDLNKNKEMDLDELIPVKVNGKKHDGLVIIDNVLLNTINFDYLNNSCELPMIKTQTKYYNYSYIVECFSKKKKKK